MNIYFDNKNTIIAVSNYKGKTIKGVAKCSPEDNFNYAKGVELAVARLRLKKAKLKAKLAVEEINKLKTKNDILRNKIAKASDFYADAIDELQSLDSELNNILEEI